MCIQRSQSIVLDRALIRIQSSGIYRSLFLHHFLCACCVLRLQRLRISNQRRSLLLRIPNFYRQKKFFWRAVIVSQTALCHYRHVDKEENACIISSAKQRQNAPAISMTIYALLIQISLALAYLLTHFLVAAAPPQSRPSFINPFLTQSINNTVEAHVYCDSAGSMINPAQIRECKSAIAFLPITSPTIQYFGPHESTRTNCLPISSTHTTRCEARVQLAPGFDRVKSSWEEIREAAWDIVYGCLRDENTVGRARTGEKYGIEVAIIYHFL